MSTDSKELFDVMTSKKPTRNKVFHSKLLLLAELIVDLIYLKLH